eukprot:4472805-Prymnesium_polylepis.1
MSTCVCQAPESVVVSSWARRAVPLARGRNSYQSRSKALQWRPSCAQPRRLGTNGPWRTRRASRRARSSSC